jgi:hypothetical protein
MSQCAMGDAQPCAEKQSGSADSAWLAIEGHGGVQCLVEGSGHRRGATPACRAYLRALGLATMPPIAPSLLPATRQAAWRGQANLAWVISARKNSPAGLSHLPVP